MRALVPAKLEEGRIRNGEMASDPSYGMAGAFWVTGPMASRLAIMSSGPDEIFGWEHVSVSLKHRTPNWQEMCFVKDLFWDENECVIQYHPAKNEYVNYHPNCLHLWRPVDGIIPVPPSILVGPK